MLSLLLAASLTASHPHPTLDQALGWDNYITSDGLSQWRAFRRPDFPEKGWTFENEELKQTGPGGGDLITKDQFGDFELFTRFKLDKAANSGILWHVVDGGIAVGSAPTAPWMSGPEFQLLEDATYPETLQPDQRCGSLYGFQAAPTEKTMNPAGEWNTARIRLRRGVLQHWLNGGKLLEMRLFNDNGTPAQEWVDQIKGSKFKDYPGFGLQPRGSIALQDHGGGVAFKDLRIRSLDEAAPGEVKLFNGQDMTGWQPFLFENNTPDEHQKVWRVEDGIIICSGNPGGYIKTNEQYKNFLLKLEWRFSPVTKQAGNSGVLLRVTGPDKGWPRSIEAQLQSGSAGDFWNIDNVPMNVPADRTKGRNTKRLITSGAKEVERPIGEWNEYEILVNKGDVILWVNGEEVNHATDAEEIAGTIALQSEGAEIHFRNIRLVPLD